MNEYKKKKKCIVFFNNLANLLQENYEEIPSCNNDISRYLCPKGTTEEVTYTGKPELSFRISDHWNWFASVNKCENERYVQCFCRDLPRPKKRINPGKPSIPINALCVAMYVDGEYKVIYGEYFDKETRTWEWKDTTPENVVSDCQNWR